ncbi:vWA domain-containing protein [Tundrisphaera lichenicola]|uniref:vWA domain-containing protein n=1 Tax=Tundrisphaera lichenicola TaxID=2029860 RepID=UPI003EBB3225
MNDPRRRSEPESPTMGGLRRSPLTDPRALVSSLLIHVLLLLIASIMAFRVATPAVESTPSRTLLGELESTDNRAESEPAGGGGGEPDGRFAELSAETALPSPPTSDPTADALLAEILPTRTSAESVAQTLPGPSTSGLGMLSGFGSGGEGGKGGGSGGGSGTATGPGTQFFGMRDRGSSFAYVIDCSGSMVARGSLDVAKRELLSSLAQIPPEARFAVIFYNIEAKVFTDSAGRPGLMAASPANKARVRELLLSVQPYGGTEHMLALRAALAVKPEVIFFLTDADLMNRQQVAEILAEAGKTRIQAIEFGLTGSLGGSVPLKQLARSSGGSYRYIDVNSFGR